MKIHPDKLHYFPKEKDGHSRLVVATQKINKAREKQQVGEDDSAAPASWCGTKRGRRSGGRSGGGNLKKGGNKAQWERYCLEASFKCDYRTSVKSRRTYKIAHIVWILGLTAKKFTMMDAYFARSTTVTHIPHVTASSAKAWHNREVAFASRVN